MEHYSVDGGSTPGRIDLTAFCEYSLSYGLGRVISCDCYRCDPGLPPDDESQVFQGAEVARKNADDNRNLKRTGRTNRVGGFTPTPPPPFRPTRRPSQQ